MLGILNRIHQYFKQKILNVLQRQNKNSLCGIAEEIIHSYFATSIADKFGKNNPKNKVIC